MNKIHLKITFFRYRVHYIILFINNVQVIIMNGLGICNLELHDILTEY